MVFGSFMISRPNLGCSHRLEFVYTRMLSRRHYSNEPVGECQCRNVIFNQLKVKKGVTNKSKIDSILPKSN